MVVVYSQISCKQNTRKIYVLLVNGRTKKAPLLLYILRICYFISANVNSCFLHVLIAYMLRQVVLFFCVS